MVNHVEGLLELLYLVLVEHGEHIAEEVKHQCVNEHSEILIPKPLLRNKSCVRDPEDQ
jgi:hypothetical protein